MFFQILTEPAVSGRLPRPVLRASHPPMRPPVDGTCPPAREPSEGTAPAQWTSGPSAPPLAVVPVKPGSAEPCFIWNSITVLLIKGF